MATRKKAPSRKRATPARSRTAAPGRAARKPIPDKIADSVLVKSRRRCCLCYFLEDDLDTKAGHIAHIDRGSSDPLLLRSSRAPA